MFYGGLVRTKNMLSMLMQVFFIECLVVHPVGRLRLQHGLLGGRIYNAFVGGLSKAFLAGDHAGHHRRDILRWRRYPGIRLHLLPDDIRRHHAAR